MPKTKVDDVNLNYRIVGDGPHTVLCLPGYLGTIDIDYGEFFEKVDKSKFRFISWDPPGYGLSIPPKREFTRGYLQRDADLVWKLMEKLDIDTYSVIGWSQGGATGLFLAASNPESVTKLITIGTEAVLGPSSCRTYAAMANLEFWPEVKREKQLKHHQKPYLLTMLHEMLDYCNNLHRSEKGEFLKQAPARVKCPVLIVHGQEDTTSALSHADVLKSRIPKSQVIIVPGAKHDVHISHTQEFIQAMEKFLLGP